MRAYSAKHMRVIFPISLISHSPDGAIFIAAIYKTLCYLSKHSTCIGKHKQLYTCTLHKQQATRRLSGDFPEHVDVLGIVSEAEASVE